MFMRETDWRETKRLRLHARRCTFEAEKAVTGLKDLDSGHLELKSRVSAYSVGNTVNTYNQVEQYFSYCVPRNTGVPLLTIQKIFLI